MVERNIIIMEVSDRDEDSGLPQHSRTTAEARKQTKRHPGQGCQNSFRRKKTEISDAVDILQRELERTEREADMARAARLESIAERLNNGTYEVDTLKLAESMLDA